MKILQPYQPLLLRIVHGLTALFLILAMITAYWTYDVYDGRWGQIPLPKFEEIEGIHGTFGLWTLLIFPTLVFYGFHQGRKRLIQRNTLSKLSHISQKGWSYHFHRVINTLTLVSLTFAVFTGKMMDEKWLPNGELNHSWYLAHLLSWVIMFISLAVHLLVSAKVGGFPFFVSMFNWFYKPQDSPLQWPNHLKTYWQNFNISWVQLWWNQTYWIKWLELLIWFSLIAAWILALLKEM
ncbi:cytochrome b/b6 domain-containing protein [Cyanothece sp. BG0011]|uniref:cytochrome b/b6 domain-containing protein n=1 Tax=Cyanothece sp. BG0011 TaxID=2082950 RepID=UPI000D1F5884|nr:cytochrome b/b6 domain-containing protein [Cyanothece sp. BG0011]